MSQLVAELERRDFPRVRRRMPCSLLIGGRCHPATVRNFSAGPDDTRFMLETYVPRNPALLRQHPRMVQSGVGLQVEDPPESYLRWLEKFGS